MKKVRKEDDEVNIDDMLDYIDNDGKLSNIITVSLLAMSFVILLIFISVYFKDYLF